MYLWSALQEGAKDDDNGVAYDDIDRAKSHRRRRVWHPTGLRSRSKSAPRSPFGQLHHHRLQLFS
jgi:hypothetical protein